MQKIFFKSGGDTVAGNLLLPQGKTPALGLLLLYGAGKHTTKDLFQELQQLLYENDIASMSIDFPGDGESSGVFADGSLRKRRAFAIGGYKELCRYVDGQSVAVLGGSMGGYVATEVISTFPDINQLLLIAPAAYGKNTENIPLGEKFTAAITKGHSWQDSVAFQIVKEFTGETLLLYGDNDAVIPKEIQEIYAESAKGKGVVKIISGGSHKLFSPNNPQEIRAKKEVFQEILAFLTKTGHGHV